MAIRLSKSRLLQVSVLLCTIVLAGKLPASGEDSLRISKGQSDVLVQAGERPVLVYQYVQRPMKPYVKELFSPGGVNVLRDSVADHKHHHGLMFAVAVDGVGFWAEGDACGRQEHRSIGGLRTFTRCGMSWAGFTQQIDWIEPGSQETLLSERRTIEVCRGTERQATLVSWHTRLEPAPGKDSVELTGSHYYGLGMRFVESMDKVGRFINADNREGELVRDDNRLVRSRWCAYTAPAAGKPVTVAIFDHPQNPRHPAWMFTMARPFAYLGATLNLWKEPMTLEAGKPLKLHYAVALWDGRVEPARIEKLYRRWIACSSTGK